MKTTLTQKAFLLLLVPIFWGFLGLFGILPLGDFPTETGTGMQAVFLNNNQTYFGKLENVDRGYVKLTNVYYLRAGGNLQGGDDASQNISLVKLGGELHGPEDAMYIRKDSILFWENMKDSSRVMQLIHTAR